LDNSLHLFSRLIAETFTCVYLNKEDTTEENFCHKKSSRKEKPQKKNRGNHSTAYKTL
jgi:hypothetical protein